MNNEIDFFEDDEQPVQEHFEINSLELAEWAMRKIARARKEIERFDEAAQKIIDKIKARVELLAKPHERTIETMTILLEPWIGIEIAKQGAKKRSYNLIGGKAGYRSNPNSIEIVDEQIAIKWLEENALECIVIKKSISKKAVNELICNTGEVPSGIEVKQGETKFYVTTDVDKIEEEMK
jgi:phage host-nuclease inhibitor protein Gam